MYVDQPTIIPPSSLDGPKPIAIVIPGVDVIKLTQAKCSPYEFNQLILAKLKDAGAPVEGMVHLKMAFGSVFKMRNSLQEEEGFTYLWLPPAYIEALNAMGGVQGKVVGVNA